MTSRTASKARAPRHLPCRAEQAEERRDQLVQIAGGLIEEGGVEAVTFPAVTERAGCARTLVYRYFESREDLLVAVMSDFLERLDAQIPEGVQHQVMATNAAEDGGDEQEMRKLVAIAWDGLMAGDLGGAILRSTPMLSERLRQVIEVFRKRSEPRFTRPLVAAGLTRDEARTAIDVIVGNFTHLALRVRRGEMSQKKAIELHRRVARGVILGLRDGD